MPINQPGGGNIPPKPPNTTNGVIGPVTENEPCLGGVAQFAVTGDGEATAEITDGQNYFRVSSLDLYDLVPQVDDPDDPDLPHRTGDPHGHRTYSWGMDAAGSVQGGGPLSVTDGQYVDVMVLATIAPGVMAAPGPFTGAVTVTAPGFNRVIPLSSTFLGVSPNTPIGQKYAAVGGVAVVGSALTNQVPPPAGSGTYQQFDNGIIWDVPGSGTFFLHGNVVQKWLSPSVATTHTAAGDTVQHQLGSPVGDSFTTVDNGTGQIFQGGAIVVRGTGAMEAVVVYGLIWGTYAQLGDLRDPAKQPVVGLPRADEDDVFAGVGRVSVFDAGNIYWLAATGAFEVHGEILARYQQENLISDLGFPTSNEQGLPDGVGRFSTFERGAIYWTPGTGAHEIYPAMLTAWRGMGGEKSWLGYPIGTPTVWTNPGSGQGGWLQQFQYGSLGATAQDAPIPYPEERVFQCQWTVPTGGAIGGNVTLTIRSDGTWNFATHTTNDSYVDTYQYSVQGLLTTASNLHLAVQYSDSIGIRGTRDDGDVNNSTNPNDPSLDPMLAQQISQLQDNWPDFRDATNFSLSHSYQDTILTGIEDIVKELVSWALTSVAVGPLAPTIVLLGTELGNITKERIVGPGGLVGVLVTGASVMFLGPLGLMVGVLAGAITDVALKFRPIHDDEYAFANLIFRGSLPPKDRLIITNASNGDRKFTVPNCDGSYLLNLGDNAYDNPLVYTQPNYPRPGQVFIHELTHAWQMYHNRFIPAFVCDVITKKRQDIDNDNENEYHYGPPDVDFSEFGAEQQAHIVDDWFGGTRGNENGHTASAYDATHQHGVYEDVNDPFFKYIENNIWEGQS